MAELSERYQVGHEKAAEKFIIYAIERLQKIFPNVKIIAINATSIGLDYMPTQIRNAKLGGNYEMVRYLQKEDWELEQASTVMTDVFVLMKGKYEREVEKCMSMLEAQTRTFHCRKISDTFWKDGQRRAEFRFE